MRSGIDRMRALAAAATAQLSHVVAGRSARLHVGARCPPTAMPSDK